MPERGRTALAVVLALAAISAGAGIGRVSAAFSSTTTRSSNVFAAAADWTAPTASQSVIDRVGDCSPGTPGYVKPSATYQVFASVTDTGNPASGTSSVTANVSALTSGQTALPLSSGSFTAGGASYNERSAAVTAGVAGSFTYSVSTADAAGNSGTQTGFPATVDGTAPAGSDVQSANGGTTAGKPEAGDSLTFTFGEQISPCSILSGWGGAATNVVVHLNNNALNDTVTVYNAANTTQLPLGTIATGRNYTTVTGDTFGASGTPSTMTQSGASITVVFGTLSGTTQSAGTGTLSWTPSSTATDRAGNACSTTTVNESGASDVDF